jgi:hypothetical protein
LGVRVRPHLHGPKVGVVRERDEHDPPKRRPLHRPYAVPDPMHWILPRPSPQIGRRRDWHPHR